MFFSGLKNLSFSFDRVIMKNLHIYLFIIASSCSGYSDAILSIICFRHPNTPLCRERTDLQNFFKSPAQISTASVGPPVKLSASASADTDNYCNAYEPHYLYYCTPGTGNQNPQAAEFCQFYPTKCDPRNIQLSMVQDVDIRQTCLQNADTARQFCDGATESGSVKTLCDQYRRYCVTAGMGTPANPLTVGQPQESTADAEKTVTAEPEPSSPFKLSGKFMENFAGSSNKQNAGTGSTGTGGINCEEQREKYQSVCLGFQQRNDDSSSSKTSQSESSSSSNDKLRDQTLENICRMDLNVMNWFCKGDAKISPRYVEHCEYYFSRCKKSSAAAEAKQQEPLQLLAADSTFCTDYHNQCYNPEEMKRLRICTEFAETKNTYCPGYPFARERTGCNKYRIFCQNLPPLKDIDGDLYHIA